jgi:putative membrane protein
MKLMMAALVCTTALGVAACGGAGDTTPAGDAGMRDEPIAERTADEPGLGERMGDALTGQRDLPQFVQEAAMANMAEIQLSQLAQKRAQNPEVRKFAQRMVTEHQKALNELRQVAQQANLQLPAELDEEHRQMHERLQGAQGADFDREYMSMMVEAHEDTVELLENRAEQRGTDAGTVGTTGDQARGTAGAGQAGEQQVSNWASKTLPSVQQHLEQARQLQQRVGNGAGTQQQGQTPQQRPGQQ